MHLRRALLLLALVLFVVAAVSALVPVPRQRTLGGGAAAAPPTPHAPARTLALRYLSPSTPKDVRAAVGAHVMLEISTAVAGQAGVPGLGLTQAAEPNTPAKFDLLASRPGTFAVRFDPAAGGSTLIGRLVVSARK